MSRVKQFIQQFCASVTGALLGMILSTGLLNEGSIYNVTFRLIDLLGLLFASFWITLLLQIIYAKESDSKMINWIKIILHYVGTLIILFFIANKLEWIGINENKNILTFAGIVTGIYIIVWAMIVQVNYQTSKQINEALTRYKNRKEFE